MTAREDLLDVIHFTECANRGTTPEQLLDAHETEAQRKVADWIEQHDPQNELPWFIDRLRAGLANHDQLRCSLCPMPDEETL